MRQRQKDGSVIGLVVFIIIVVSIGAMIIIGGWTKRTVEDLSTTNNMTREPVASGEIDLGGNSGNETRSTEPCAKPAPQFTLKDVNGKVVSLSDFSGKVIILDFWATWCGPCVREIPTFIQLQNEYENKGLMVVGISLDDHRTVARLPAFVREKGINYPILYGSAQVVATYGGITSIPTTFIIDRDGCIVKKVVGMHSKAQFESYIGPLIEESVVMGIAGRSNQNG